MHLLEHIRCPAFKSPLYAVMWNESGTILPRGYKNRSKDVRFLSLTIQAHKTPRHLIYYEKKAN